MYRTRIALALLGVSTLAASAVQAQSVGRYPKGIETPFNGTAEEAYIKEEIRGAGYSGVNSLERDTDGTWHARAYKGPADVQVAIDRSGHITEAHQ